MPEFDAVINAVRAAVDERNARRDALAARIEKIIRESAEACALDTVHVGPYRIALADVTARCSQGQGWPVIHPSESHWIVNGLYSFGILDLSFFDGHNQQRQDGRACAHDAPLDPAPVKVLREIAAALPEVVARILSEREATVKREATEASEAASAL